MASAKTFSNRPHQTVVHHFGRRDATQDGTEAEGTVPGMPHLHPLAGLCWLPLSQHHPERVGPKMGGGAVLRLIRGQDSA